MRDIGLISPYPELTRLAQEVIEETREDVWLVDGLLDQGGEVAPQLVDEGVKVLISRGGTVMSIQSKVTIPVVEIPITGYDLARAISEAKHYGNRIGVIGFQNMLFQVEELADILGVEITKIHLTNSERAESVIAKLRERVREKRDLDAVIGGVITVEMARKYGLNSVMIRTGKNAIYQAIAEAKRILHVRLDEMRQTKIFQTILEYTTDGILVIDNKGIITAINKKMGELLEVQTGEAFGKNILQVYPETRMLAALKKGEPEYNKLETVKNKTLAINRIPLEMEDKILGIVSTCQDVTYIEKLEQKYRTEVLSRGHVARHHFEDIIGNSAEIEQALLKARRFSKVDSNIMIYGESGTGKEIFAQSIHNVSWRRQAPFVAVNCAALPENLLESELFGYADGAFTGAIKGGKRGLFELAHGGTIFLDEVSEMSPKLQARLLRVLQEREVRRIGDDRVIHVDLRVISASNRDLFQLVQQSEFREDLLYRLDVLRLMLPPLQKRKGDIPLLVESMIQNLSKVMLKNIKKVSSDALETLNNYSWPGNVRQLSNVIEQAVVLSDEEVISRELIEEILLEKKTVLFRKDQYLDVNITNSSQGPIPMEMTSLAQMISHLEKYIIKHYLEHNSGNQKQTADLLGIDRTTLWRKLNKE